MGVKKNDEKNRGKKHAGTQWENTIDFNRKNKTEISDWVQKKMNDLKFRERRNEQKNARKTPTMVAWKGTEAFTHFLVGILYP
jgi:hypothetical protein